MRLPRRPAAALGLAAAVALPLLGLRFHFFEIEPLNLLLSIAWFAAVSLAFDSLNHWPELAGGLAALSILAFLALALLGRHQALATVSVLSLAARILLQFVSRSRRPQFSALGSAGPLLSGLLLAAAGVIAASKDGLRFGSWMTGGVILGVTVHNLGTWMAPGVILGIPLASLGFGLWQTVSRSGKAPTPQAAPDLLDHLAGQFATDRRRTTIGLWAAGAGLGLAALAMSYLPPLTNHLLLGALGAAGIVALNFRRVRALGLGPAAVYAFAFGILLLFVGSLKYRYLNELFPGDMAGNIGWDFFQAPRAFDYLIHGVTFYHRRPEIYQSHYAPYATEPTALYPLMVVLPGGLLYLMPPFVAYTVFVVCIVAALFWLYRLFAGLVADAWQRCLIALFLFASWPLYLLLWMGQFHIFPWISYGLVAVALIAALDERERNRGWERLLGAGLLVGLFSKPIVIFLLPVLLAARPTRRAAAVTIAIYAGVSLLFVVVPFLNPGQAPISDWLSGRIRLREFLESGNMYHWTYILSRGGWMATNFREIFSLPTILNVVLPARIIIRFGQVLTVTLVAYTAWIAARARSRDWTLYLLVLAACLLNAAYFLSYPLIFEYQFTTLAIIPISLLLLASRTSDQRLRRYLWLGAAFYVPLLLPSAYGWIAPNPPVDVFWDYTGETLQQMTQFRASRVVPVIFIVLALLLAIVRARLLARQGAAVTEAARPGP